MENGYGHVLQGGARMNQDTLAFVVYLINVCADKWNTTPSNVYKKLKETDCIENYLVPFYDVLHTLSSAYMEEDIRGYLTKRGVNI